MDEKQAADKNAKPSWWPTNPYPESIFPMPPEKYEDVVPDPKMRTALSGMLGREFWEIASGSIWSAYQAQQDDLTAQLAEAVEYHQDCYEALLAVQLDLAAADKEIERLRKDNEELRKKSINN